MNIEIYSSRNLESKTKNVLARQCCKGKKSSRGCGAMPDAAKAGGGEGEDGEEGGPQAAHQVGQHSL